MSKIVFNDLSDLFWFKERRLLSNLRGLKFYVYEWVLNSSRIGVKHKFIAQLVDEGVILFNGEDIYPEDFSEIKSRHGDGLCFNDYVNVLTCIKTQSILLTDDLKLKKVCQEESVPVIGTGKTIEMITKHYDIK